MIRTNAEGSVWRRWDLHVHTPGTALNDQYGEWEEFLVAIESQSDVKVIGVTDYMSISNYSKLKRHKANGRLRNVDLLLPNLEFRIAPPTDKATAVNVHLLVSPDDPNHEQEILSALGRLSWEYNERKYSCLPDQLIALGRAFEPAQSKEHAALAVGTIQFKIDFTTLREWYRGEHWLSQNSLVCVDAGKDGLSGFRRDGAWAGFRDEITRFAMILFSGRPKEREFWLGQGSDEDTETVARLGGPRPCLHGSDAHKIADLFRPDGDRFCWIKADPTFEGLRQVVYEPDHRVHIGPSSPMFHDRSRVISCVKLFGASGWFDQVEIPLNSGLVSIIGQKGSGKSALAEIIAYAAGSWTAESGSFLQRAGSHIGDLEVELTWADATRSRARLNEEQPGGSKVRYLSQKFVERLCADDQIGTELVREIEGVIFAHTDPTDTLNASNFEELRSIKTQGVRAEGQLLREDILRLIEEETVLRANAAKLPNKTDRIKTLREEKDGLQKQVPAAASPAEQANREELQKRRLALAAAQQAIGREKQKLQKVADIRSRVTAQKAQMIRFHSELELLLEEADVPAEDRALFRLGFEADTDPPLTRRASALRQSIIAKNGTEENPAEGTVRWLGARIKALEDEESADKAKQEKVRVIQTRLAAIDVELGRLEAEISAIEGPEHDRLTASRSERSKAYVAYFENLRREQATLQELYDPVKARLASESTAPPEQQLEFSIRWDADVDAWLQKGGSLFDQRTTIPYGTMQELAEATRTTLVPAWTSGSPKGIGDAMERFLVPFRDGQLSPSKYLRAGVTVQNVVEWFYSVDHVTLTYGLKYNGIELSKLSPGTKGIVLLILYLGMDTADTRPLIVDQPDENLDNESIYQLLTTYFKRAKGRRQVILITHNPNLVVNADSEQVVVACCDRREGGLPFISYESGSLEDGRREEQGIRQQVCRILEGGRDAFRKRERRYSLGES